jgi:hypothetical protein
MAPDGGPERAGEEVEDSGRPDFAAEAMTPARAILDCLILHEGEVQTVRVVRRQSRLARILTFLTLHEFRLRTRALAPGRSTQAPIDLPADCTSHGSRIRIIAIFRTR